LTSKHDADDYVPLVEEETVIWRMFDGLNEIGRSYGMKMNVEKSKNEMGGACSAYGGEERRIQGFGGVT
jgi:hypothetical protein